MMMTFAAVLCCVATFILSSCNTNDDIPVNNDDTEQLADYTIIYYANGGGNADEYQMPMIGDFYGASAEAYEWVNVVVQYQYSSAENMKKQSLFQDEFCDEWGSKTVRWAIDPQKNLSSQMGDQENIYGTDNADCTCPDSLTNFINWAAKNYPAKNYMLILNDHSNGYTPDDELAGHFTAKSLKRAIANANVRLQTIYMQSSLMNNLEYQFELKDLCDYMMASTYVMPDDVGTLGLMVEILNAFYNDIEEGLSTYCSINVETSEYGFDPETPIYTDLTVTRTANLDKLGEMMREFTDRLCDTYTNGTEQQKQLIDNCTKQAVKIDATQPSYDATKYMASIMNALPEVYDDDFVQKMADTINSCILAQNFSSYLINHNYIVDYSVLLGVEDSLAPWKSTFDDTYGQLEFDRLVGWSRWIKLNF